jgi:hypothetical protein
MQHNTADPLHLHLLGLLSLFHAAVHHPLRAFGTGTGLGERNRPATHARRQPVRAGPSGSGPGLGRTLPEAAFRPNR